MESDALPLRNEVDQRNTNEHSGKGTCTAHDWGHSLFTHLPPCQPKVSKRGFKIKLTSHFLPNGFILFFSDVFISESFSPRGTPLSRI